MYTDKEIACLAGLKQAGLRVFVFTHGEPTSEQAEIMSDNEFSRVGGMTLSEIYRGCLDAQRAYVVLGVERAPEADEFAVNMDPWFLMRCIFVD